MNVSDKAGGSAIVSCFSEAENYNLIDIEPAQEDHDYVDVPNILSLSE